jgi:hypothetical protein
MKIFNSIKVYDPSVLNMIKESIDGDIIKLVVEFLKNIVVGNE